MTTLEVGRPSLGLGQVRHNSAVTGQVYGQSERWSTDSGVGSRNGSEAPGDGTEPKLLPGLSNAVKLDPVPTGAEPVKLHIWLCDGGIAPLVSEVAVGRALTWSRVAPVALINWINGQMPPGAVTSPPCSYQQTEVSDFVERLKAMSMYEGVVYGRVRGLELASEQYRETISKYGGYGNLADAFQAFFLETMETANALGLALPTISQGYTWFVRRIAHDFRSLRAAEIVTQHGYPYQAYTILRNTFDNVVMTAAALQGVVHWLHVDGIDPSKQGTPVDPEAARKLRMSTERKALSEMTGKKSGLPLETLTAVQHWDSLFNLEVHGGRLSLTGAMDWMQAKAPLALGPTFVEHHFAMYMNRFIEIAWMVHRLLPLVQTEDVELPSRWRDQWRLLDEVFEAMVLSLTVNLGKEIGAAMVEFVNQKFPFDLTSKFPDLGPET